MQDHREALEQLRSWRAHARELPQGSLPIFRAVATVIDQLEREIGSMAKTIQQIAADAQALSGRLEAEIVERKQADDQMKGLVEGLTAQNAGLKLQLEAALAAGGTPEQLAAIEAALVSANAQTQLLSDYTDATNATATANTPQ